MATGFMGTYIHRVLVFDGYLYSRVYGIRSSLCCDVSRSFSIPVLLACGFITLIPIPSQFVGHIGQCIAAGLLMM